MEKKMISQNPSINLYHVASYESLDYIFTEGIYPLTQLFNSKIAENFKDEYKNKTIEEIIENEPVHKVKKKLYDNFPEHKDSVFLWKDKPFIMYEMRGYPIKIHADKIPCQCSEGNSEILEKLFKKYAQSLTTSYKIPEEKLQKLEKEYKDSIRVLDDKENAYRTEVMCPCHIPIEAIDIPKLFEQFQKRNQ